ncbi:unnamed protein product [Acanthoscelides obtectus]|uniref:Cadherin domain-containing protein n=1 Tax=Acanthoscelides obtectus TaxID=200917 RepID=A0A9P0MJ90_ACAOB|nr:unnamed protein product [Acanthoscelides obtectus]CAK1631794.1 Cadherin-related tumor suppressor [Acanthoscelides obtectus]
MVELNGEDMKRNPLNTAAIDAQGKQDFEMNDRISTASKLFKVLNIQFLGRKEISARAMKVRITVLDKNDSPPSFPAPLRFQVSEELPAGQPVATLKASDPDTIGSLEYSLTNGSEHFSLDATTGVLKLKETLDREQRDEYQLAVRCSDGVQYTDAVVTIEVLDTNDNPPAFLEPAYSFDIPENAVRGHRVGKVQAVDPDLGINAQLTYSVISDWANDVFSLNPQTGVFTLTAKLDYEEVSLI